MNPKASRLAEVSLVLPGSIFLRFLDGFQGIWTFEAAGLNMDGLEPVLAEVNKDDAATLKCLVNVELDGSMLRAAVDDAYFAEAQAEMLALRGPLENSKTNTVSMPGPVAKLSELVRSLRKEMLASCESSFGVILGVGNASAIAQEQIRERWNANTEKMIKECLG